MSDTQEVNPVACRNCGEPIYDLTTEGRANPMYHYHGYDDDACQVALKKEIARVRAENARLREDAEALNLLTVPEVVHETMKDCDWQDYDAVAGVLHEARKFALDTARAAFAAENNT